MWGKHRSKWSTRLGSCFSRPLFTGHSEIFRNKSPHFREMLGTSKPRWPWKSKKCRSTATFPSLTLWKNFFPKIPQTKRPTFGTSDWLKLVGFFVYKEKRGLETKETRWRFLPSFSFSHSLLYFFQQFCLVFALGACPTLPLTNMLYVEYCIGLSKSESLELAFNDIPHTKSCPNPNISD